MSLGREILNSVIWFRQTRVLVFIKVTIFIFICYCITLFSEMQFENLMFELLLFTVKGQQISPICTNLEFQETKFHNITRKFKVSLNRENLLCLE